MLIALVVVALPLACQLACSCPCGVRESSDPPPPSRARPATGPVTLDLTWTDYDGTGDKARAAYVLGGEPTGRGKAGYVERCERIRRLPRGSVVYVRPYYGDPGARTLDYPFLMPDLVSFADQHGVAVRVPGAA